MYSVLFELYEIGFFSVLLCMSTRAIYSSLLLLSKKIFSLPVLNSFLKLSNSEETMEPSFRLTLTLRVSVLIVIKSSVFKASLDGMSCSFL